jgi:hypothetical protein
VRRSCGFVEREGLFAFEGDRRTAKMEDFDEEIESFFEIKTPSKKKKKKAKKVINK